MEGCGVICLLSTFLIPNGIADHDSRFRWQHKAYNFSDYARYVLIKWYFQNKACITDILTQDKQDQKVKVIF